MFLGLDIGTQSVKALIIDRKFRSVGIGSFPLQYTALSGGRVEQHAEHWLEALRPAIADALTAAGLGPSAISAIGIGGQLDGCLPVDVAGLPLHPCLIWMDRRAEHVLAGIPASTILQRCGIVRDASHMAAKIFWLRQERPSLYARTAVFHQPVSFVVLKLTGVSVMDRALASTTMLYDLAAKEFSEELCGIFNVEATRLPRLANMVEEAGKLTRQGSLLTGLPAGLPVSVGTGDDFTNAIGAGIIAPGAMLCQIGTGEVTGALHHAPITDATGLLETHEFGNGLYLIENPGWLSGGAIEWLVRLLRLSGVQELNTLAASVAPGSDGVIFFPALTGAMAPEWNAGVHACFHNLRAEHGPAHLARAVLEGTAFAMRDVQLRLLEMGVSFDRIVLAGGGASSELWSRIRASVAQMPVHVCDVKDASPLGAAVLAAVVGGAIRTIEDAEPHLTRREVRILPDPTTRAVYEHAHANYRSLYAHLKSLAAGPPQTRI